MVRHGSKEKAGYVEINIIFTNKHTFSGLQLLIMMIKAARIDQGIYSLIPAEQHRHGLEYGEWKYMKY